MSLNNSLSRGGGKVGRYASDRALAERFGVDRCTIWRWYRAGLFPAPVKLSPGCTRWALDDIEAHEASLREQT
jgi:prophage regulatory protein